MADEIFDLFGMPVRSRREGRGRPEHAWSEENSHKISLLLAIGHEVSEIAEIIGVSQPTLRKHYFSELQARRTAAQRLLAKQLYRLNRQAEAGNVAAEKALFGMIEREKTRQLSDRLAAPNRQPKVTAPRPLGKKEVAEAEALGVTGLYAPPVAGLALN